MEIDGVTKILLSSHAMLAGVTKTPELAIEESEAKALAVAIADVQSYYDTVISPKTLAWINLGQAVGLIYGTRMYAISTRRAQERAERRARTQGAPRPQPGNATANSAKPPAGRENPQDAFLPSELNQVTMPEM